MISDTIQLEYKVNYISVAFGLLIIAFSVIGSAYIQENFSIYEFKDICLISLFISAVIRIIVYFYASELILKLNRNYFLWILMIIGSPAFALIRLGFLEYKIDNKLIKNAVKETRFEYHHELTSLKFQDNTGNLEAQCEKIKEQYQIMLKERIDYIIREGKDIEKSPVLTKEEENTTAEFADMHYEYCPACNYKLTGSPKKCPDCGLSLY